MYSDLALLRINGEFVTTLYTPNVRRIWNYKERDGNATASEAYIAVTLHNRLVRLKRHGNDTTSKAYVFVMLHDPLVREYLQRSGDFFKQF